MSRNNDRRNARRQNNGGWQQTSSTNKVAAKATTMAGGEDPTQLTAVESFLRKGVANRLSDTYRVNTTHVDASAFKVREYVQRRRVTVRWIPTGECLGDIFTKNTIEAEQFFRLWHTLCGYKS